MTPVVVKTLGQRLRTYRLQRNMTQEALAAASGVSQSMISKLERGSRIEPGWSVLRDLEEGLGEPRVSLGDDLVDPTKANRSLDGFLASEIAAELELTDEEVTALRRFPWYGPDEEPTLAAWVDFVRARRALRRKLKG